MTVNRNEANERLGEVLWETIRKWKVNSNSGSEKSQTDTKHVDYRLKEGERKKAS